MIIHKTEFKLLRNDFGEMPSDLEVIEQGLYEARASVADETKKSVRLGIRCSRSLLEKNTNNEVYGHLSEYWAVVENNKVAYNEQERLSKFVSDFILNINKAYLDKKPDTFPDFNFKPLNKNQLIDDLMEVLDQTVYRS